MSFFCRVLVFLGLITYLTVAQEEEYELTPQDGWYNNLLHPDWGGIDGQLLRKSLAAYSDGVYEPSGKDRPNPFILSQTAHHGDPGLGSLRNRTALLVYFGQQVVEEILDAQRPGCPREYFNVPIPKDHEELQKRYNPENKDNLEMPFLRTRYDQTTGYSPNNPRQQLNEITPYLDGGLTYGTSKTWTDAIREFEGGRLLALGGKHDPIEDSFPAENDIRLPLVNPPPPRDHTLKPVKRFWRLGNPRGNENPMLLSFAVMWFRWHNKLALDISKEHTDWDDEKIFNEARKYLIAHYQKIVMYDWLPHYLEINEQYKAMDIPSYNRYNPDIHPGISQEFQSAAMRFGHTLVTPGLWVRDRSISTCAWKTFKINIPGEPTDVHALRLCNSYWNSQETVEPDLEGILMGMASTISEKEDHILVPDIREHLFGPLEFSRRDLAALNIQRARDHGLPDFNTIREAYGLKRISTWNELNNLTEMQDGPITQVRQLYQNASSPDNLDLFTGGILETTGDGPGSTFKEIIKEQFLRIRDADRFWYQNEYNGLFTGEEITEINNITLHEIITSVTRIRPDEIQQNVFVFPLDGTGLCYQPAQLNAMDGRMLENCTKIQYFDYFESSQISFALTFLFTALAIPATIGVMMLMVWRRQKSIQKARRRQAPKRSTKKDDTFPAVEWIGPTLGERNVKIKFEKQRKKVYVTDRRGVPLRMIDMRYNEKVHLRISTDKEENILSFRAPGEIDLVLKFGDKEDRDEFERNLDEFLRNLSVKRDRHEMSQDMIFREAETKEERQILLDKFFRVVCMQAFNKQPGEMQLECLHSDTANKIVNIQLTRTEFSDALGIKPTSLFSRNMFLLVDRNRDGLIGFREFMDMFIVLSKGNAEEKARLIFNMYDLNRSGKLSRKEFEKMISSMLDLADTTIADVELKQLVQTMYTHAGIGSSGDMDFAEFKKIFASEEYEKTLRDATLTLEFDNKMIGQGKKRYASARKSFLKENTNRGDANDTLSRKDSHIQIRTKQKELPQSQFGQKLYAITRYIENYRLQIFWFTLFTLVTLGIFVERAYYYSFEREHTGLRRIAGYGVTITRGAASCMMFTYSCLLVTMSRNTITFLRETFLHRFIPFDSAHSMHIYIAVLALFFTVMHIIGHAINLYHISTQTASDVACIFREFFRATDQLASFHYWAYATITGLTGIILTVLLIVMYVFALPYARRNLFKAFWFTHNWYIIVYIFTVLHGSGRLVQSPLFHYFFLGPAVLYVLDKLMTFSRNKIEIRVVKAEQLPSDVLALVFKRPLNFEYQSGQWVRVACVELGESEYHPFTLTSAPHEEHLSLHIRAVGPWTMNMRTTYDINNRELKDLPLLYLDGPFGEGHQDWYKFRVSVLVGGGIGVTPFASILKDIVHRSKLAAVRFPCQKVYFLWVSRNQKQFEWLTDIIREVENNDRKNLVAIHIFITQFQQKFDLRTTMLYICERNFQKIADKSLFTGLKATTHFGRPQFDDFFMSLKYEHPGVNQIGVFSCGPPPMTLSVQKSCDAVNKIRDFPSFHHHFENF